MHSVPPAMMTSESVSAARRPARSAYAPSTTAPTGRAMKPTPKMRKALMRAATPSEPTNTFFAI